MKNLTIGVKSYTIQMNHKDGSTNYIPFFEEDGEILNAYINSVNYKMPLNQYLSNSDITSHEIVEVREPVEIKNATRFVKALQERHEFIEWQNGNINTAFYKPLTECEAIMLLKKFFLNCKGKTPKKTATEIYEMATFSYTSYETIPGVHEYNNSFLEEIRTV
ncbi:MAG: hypothetical protein FWG64_01425 [Firmicutes bacterium]|nr:hypothetical protein [Bacillota bacterium]